MANKSPYHITFEVENCLEPVFTGGSVGLDQNGRILATTLGEDALLTDLSTGKQLAKIEGDGEDISTLALTPSASHLIICSRSLSMRIYSLRPTTDGTIKYEIVRTLKPHTTPVIVLAVDRSSTLLATGAADGVVKVWDITRGYVTHTLPGPNVLVSALHFFELSASNAEGGISPRNGKDRQNGPPQQTTRGFRLASGSQDGKVRVWDLHSRKSTPVAILDSHVTDVRAIDYSSEQNALLTGSRDKTIMWWDSRTWKIRKVVPVLEEVEAAGFIDNMLVYTGGANGHVRLWESESGHEVSEPQMPRSETDAIVSATYYEGHIMSIRVDHTIAVLQVPSLEQIRRISGTHEEIIDLCYLCPNNSLLALATNTEELRIISISADSTYFGEDVAQLKGHEDIIICLAVDWSGHWIATGAKDNTARLWRSELHENWNKRKNCFTLRETKSSYNSTPAYAGAMLISLVDPSNNSFTCYATFTGHAESLGALAIPQTPPSSNSPQFTSPLDHPPKYLITGSQDQTVKRWLVPAQGKPPRATYTRKAHDKDINAIDISSGSTNLFASASQDKTVKIWSVEEGEVQGVLRGHKRGVWSVKFAPASAPTLAGVTGASKGLVLTGSGDKTLKIWNLADYSCIRTFEGHSNSVLKVLWMVLPGTIEGDTRKHVQIASAGGDGLVKLWDATTGEIETTLDNHTDRVWSLAVHQATNMLVSGSSDSTISFWKDTTSQTQARKMEQATQFVEQEQELQNYIREGSYRKAITLALQLNHPKRLLDLLSAVAIQDEAGSLCGNKVVDEVLRTLSDEQIYLLLLRLRDWNTNNRTSGVAQRILWTLVKSYPAKKLSSLKVKEEKGKSLKEILDGISVYTERHYKRMEELIDDSYLIEYTLQEMDGLLVDSGVEMSE